MRSRLLNENYVVYEDGRVFSRSLGRFLKPDNVGGYYQYTLRYPYGTFRAKAHRLVAALFLDTPEDYENYVVNHLDGNKHNNTPENLEWTTQYGNNLHARMTGLNPVSKTNSERWKDPEWAAKTKAHFSEIHQGMYRHRDNPRFRYVITDKSGKEYTRTELAALLGRAQSGVDANLKKAANGCTIPIFDKFGISVKDTKCG